jgi:hypothetical protein
MTDPVLVMVLVAAFAVAITLAHYFKSLDLRLWDDAITPLVLGVVTGVVLRFVDSIAMRVVAIGVLLTIAAVYVRLTGRESEPSDGMTLGAITGAAATTPLLTRGDVLLTLAGCIVAGAIAGYGITFGLTHVRDKVRQAIVDAVTAALAIGGAYLPLLLARSGVRARDLAIAAVALVPLLIVGTVFKQWPAVRAELQDEAALDVLLPDDVRATAHPFLRMGRGGWHDARAHAEFVRTATKIALRKRQQRRRPDEIARLYQLEVIKLRMQAQDMLRVDRAMRAAAAAQS